MHHSTYEGTKQFYSLISMNPRFWVFQESDLISQSTISICPFQDLINLTSRECVREFTVTVNCQFGVSNLESLFCFGVDKVTVSLMMQMSQVRIGTGKREKNVPEIIYRCSNKCC